VSEAGRKDHYQNERYSFHLSFTRVFASSQAASGLLTLAGRRKEPFSSAGKSYANTTMLSTTRNAEIAFMIHTFLYYTGPRMRLYAIVLDIGHS
jgi:hypothetical protein